MVAAGSIPNTWGRSLKSLLLRNNQLTGPPPAALSDCDSLALIDMGVNQLDGGIPDDYQHLSSLRVLVLSDNALTGPIPASIARLSKLQVLALSGNKLEGPIPTNLSGLSGFRVNASLITSSGTRSRFPTTLYEEVPDLNVKGESVTYDYILRTNTIFDLSSNRLNSTIPPEIGDYLSTTKILNLSRNSLEGNIPSSIRDASYLESLDLSYNRLSGGIPSSLAGLDFMGTFRVAGNNLSGPIPTSGQFISFTASSFVPGNPLLCGRQINVTCDKTTPLPKVGSQGHMPADRHAHVSPVSFTALSIGFVAGFVGLGMFMYTNKKIRDYIFRTGQHAYEPEFYMARHGLFKTPQVWTQ